jgi:hypothetical protein
MMNISIKPAAVDYLKAHTTNQDHLFLALDDGSSKYSKLGGTCAIGNKFQIVESPDADADYAIALDTDTDLKLTTGEEEEMYLGHGLVLDFQQASLVLRDDSGILDGAVNISQPVVLTAEMQAAMGGKIC